MRTGNNDTMTFVTFVGNQTIDQTNVVMVGPLSAMNVIALVIKVDFVHTIELVAKKSGPLAT